MVHYFGRFKNYSKFPIIDGVGKPYNLLYCTPPKSGTTSWMQGVAVLKDKNDGIDRRPDDYVPRQLFNMHTKDAFNPYQYINDRPEKFQNVENWTKIVAVRNPLTRLYSAWKDKSRTFRFENGTVDWEKAIAETTWAWGTENMKKQEKSKLLSKALKSHDAEFDPKLFGIDKFEDRDSNFFIVLKIYGNCFIRSLVQADGGIRKCSSKSTQNFIRTA